MKRPLKRQRAQPLRSLTDTMLKINATMNQEPLGTPQAAEPRAKTKLFLSFSKHDVDIAAAIAAELDAKDYAVWWSGLLTAGQHFPDEISDRLDEADAVIVVWSQASIKTKWVISEATRANEQKKLVPVRLGTLDPTAIPLPFGTLHTVLLGDVDALVHAIDRIYDAASPGAARSTPSPTK